MTLEKRTELQEKPLRYDHHSPGFRERVPEITQDIHSGCPIAWSDAYGGFWVTGGYEEASTIARSRTLLSSDHDPLGKRKGYEGITIPPTLTIQTGFLEMDPPEQHDYRVALNPYLSPAAVARWKPMADDLTRACINETIESGHIDFVDDLVHVVPAVLTMGMLGQPLEDWSLYSDPIRALTSTPPDSPERTRGEEGVANMFKRLSDAVATCREHPQPGWIDALIRARICGEAPDDEEILGTLFLLIGAGFDTTKGWTANSLEWLSEHPSERERLRTNLEELLDSASEEFLRYFTPSPGDGRTVTRECELAGVTLKEGDRLWLAWNIANRDPAVFPDPDNVHLDRKFNRHGSFGLGLHRCIGSNLARMIYKAMLPQILERMPDFVCIPEDTVRYATIGIVNGVHHLPANFTPGPRIGAGFEETMQRWQKTCVAEGHAEPVARPPGE